MSTIKVLVVDDSAFMRKVIKDLLEADKTIQVIGTARNGQDALDKVPQLQPDVITLDVEMPVLDGLDTLQELVGTYKIPVIMLSSTTKAGAENTVIALERGAFDFITKPSGSISLDLHKVQAEMIEKVKLAYQHRIKKHQPPMIKRVQGKQPEKATVFTERPRPDLKLQNIVLIGTSTGGPKALQRVLSSLPKYEHTAILVVQHMPPAFTLSLANRLNQLCPYEVVEAKDGDLIKGGMVYIAPGGLHMTIRSLQQQNLAIHLTNEQPRGGHRPAVDVMFESAVQIKEQRIISVIMTGMGKDGTAGLQRLKQEKKVYSIAEDESTCIVYGMPRAAVEAGLINETIPLEEIHLVLQRLIQD